MAIDVKAGASNAQNITGRLPGGTMVSLLPETVRYAKSWNFADRGIASLDNDQMSLVKAFNDLCNEYDQPFIIDVGASVGTFSLVGAGRDAVRGWSFEPLPAVHDILRSNITINGMESRFVTYEKALSNFTGRTVLKSPYNDKESRLSSIGQPNYKNYKEYHVDVVKLDDLVMSNEIESVDIMKIDTEGCELFVLLGAAETISRYKPDILIKVNWATLIQFSVYANNLMDYLDLIGYHGHWVGTEDMIFRHPYKKAGIPKKHFANKPDIGGLKVAIIKQRYDLFGPWRGENWNPAQPLSILKKWPSRYLYFEMTHLLQADWYILPFCHDSRIVRQKIDDHQQIFDDHMEHMQSIEEIPVDNYDVIITLDPIIRPPQNGKTLYAYYQNEHHDDEYRRSLKNPLPGYDLFLDHILDAPDFIYDLPQSIAFPYLRDPYVARSICHEKKDDIIWFDKRFIMMLTHGNEACHRNGFEQTLASLELRFGMRVKFRNVDYENIIGWGDPQEYMRDMSACKYYINLIACGAGQGLCDAASLGLICFGSPKLPYHRVICHPLCLCQDLCELDLKLSLVRGSAGLQQEIIAWQDATLSDRLVAQPLRLLHSAVEMKRKRQQSTKAVSHPSTSPMITELVVGDLLPNIGQINSEKLKLRAQAEYEKGNYEEVIHNCKQALWFNDTDCELYYFLSLAYYAVKDTKNTLLNLAQSIKINDKYRPAIAFNNILKYDILEYKEKITSIDENYHFCSSRVQDFVYYNFTTYDKEIDYENIKQYNLIFDETMKKSIKQDERVAYTLTMHYMMRLNAIAGL